ncbi:MAG: Glu-tRNA(Gln) amidotransferase subunit GatD [Candidatus Woesearchaeota archaeon]
MRHVKLHLEHEIIEGLLVTEDEKRYTLKLSSGYNIGIQKHRVQRVEEIVIVPSHSKIAEHKTPTHQSTALPKILILHTGGTIASKVDYRTGGVIPRFSPQDLIEMFPEVKELASIDSELFRSMWSEDLRFVHYNLLAERVAVEIKKNPDIKGVIIAHGTDTIHYTTAALSFIFEHLPIPVVIVGSQRSSDRGSSDAAINLVSAVAFIANTSLNGVFICMHENMNDDSCIILNGLNARKMHSSRRDAFKPINVPPIARVDYNSRSVEYLSEYPESILNTPGVLKLHLFNPGLKIGILKSHPNMFVEEILCYKNFDGLILEGTGLCNFPVNKIDEYTDEHVNIMDALRSLAQKMPVVMALQTVYGRVNMNVYQTGRDLQTTGILGNHSSLTSETAFIKLAWLISQKLDPQEYFMKDLRGELSGKSVE